LDVSHSVISLAREVFALQRRIRLFALNGRKCRKVGLISAAVTVVRECLPLLDLKPSVTQEIYDLGAPAIAVMSC